MLLAHLVACSHGALTVQVPHTAEKVVHSRFRVEKSRDDDRIEQEIGEGGYSRTLKMNRLQQVVAVVFFVWATVSGVIVLIRGGSFFDERRESSYDAILKHTPPLWRKVTIWLWPLLVVGAIISLFL